MVYFDEQDNEQVFKQLVLTHPFIELRYRKKIDHNVYLLFEIHEDRTLQCSNFDLIIGSFLKNVKKLRLSIYFNAIEYKECFTSFDDPTDFVCDTKYIDIKTTRKKEKEDFSFKSLRNTNGNG